MWAPPYFDFLSIQFWSCLSQSWQQIMNVITRRLLTNETMIVRLQARWVVLYIRWVALS